MSLEIKIPNVAESINEVTIMQWLKNDGDFVNQNDIVCELETDKASFELPAEASGILRITAKAGETIAVGAVVGRIEEAGNGQATTKIQETTAQQTQTTQTVANTTPKTSGEVREIKVTPIAEAITEVTIGNWLKNDGDYVKQDEALCEVETDKATQEFTAEVGGILRIVAKTGTVLKIGDTICKIEVAEAPVLATTTVETQATTTQATTTVSNEANYASGHPSPAASKILAEKGLKPTDIQGTGIDGRITKEDAQKAQIQSTQQQTEANKAVPQAQITNTGTGNRTEQRSRLSQLRKTIARRLVAVKNETAMLTTFNEVNMKPIMDLRAKYKDIFKEKYNIGLGFMSFFVKACCVALKEFPQVNAKIDGDEMVLHDYCDVSIAVSTPRGLVVPIIRNAEALNFAQIEQTIIDLATKARDNKLSIPEMQGGTFTITNGGVFGSMMSTPIINAPQSAILGMHNIVDRAVVVKGEVVVRPMMYVALSYDHRIIDGRESVSFLVRVKQLLEEPERLLLEI